MDYLSGDTMGYSPLGRIMVVVIGLLSLVAGYEAYLTLHSIVFGILAVPATLILAGATIACLGVLNVAVVLAVLAIIGGLSWGWRRLRAISG
jgi:hypothetical protein